jgi:AraC-like DNA-binding protein
MRRAAARPRTARAGLPARIVHPHQPGVPAGLPGQPETPSRGEAITRQFKELVGEHFLRKKRVQDYADLLCITPRHLTDTVTTSSGRPPSHWILTMEMLEARYLLRYSGRTVAEIAGHLGYPDPAYFSKVFRKAAGCTPSQYRQGVNAHVFTRKSHVCHSQRAARKALLCPVSTPNKPRIMNANKITLSVVLGAVYWLLAALFVRAFGPFFFTGHSPWLPVLYAASVPGSWLLLANARWLGRLAPSEVLDSTVIMTGVAALLDGLGITFYQSLYGPSPQVVMLGAAWILWGAGCGLGIAYRIKRGAGKPGNPITHALLPDDNVHAKAV